MPLAIVFANKICVFVVAIAKHTVIQNADLLLWHCMITLIRPELLRRRLNKGQTIKPNKNTRHVFRVLMSV